MPVLLDNSRTCRECSFIFWVHRAGNDRFMTCWMPKSIKRTNRVSTACRSSEIYDDHLDLEMATASTSSTTGPHRHWSFVLAYTASPSGRRQSFIDVKYHPSPVFFFSCTSNRLLVNPVRIIPILEIFFSKAHSFALWGYTSFNWHSYRHFLFCWTSSLVQCFPFLCILGKKSLNFKFWLLRRVRLHALTTRWVIVSVIIKW